jgi:cytochrome c oxidase subunit 3
VSEPYLAEQFGSRAVQDHSVRFGFWAFLGSEVMLFAGLFVLYAAYRAMYGEEFIHAIRSNNIYIGTANTLILITSSLTVALAVAAARAGRLRVVPWLFAITISLGVVFLILKTIEYRQHYDEGLLFGPYYRSAELTSFGAQRLFTLYWVMTGLHALHVTAGLIALAWIAVRSLGRAYTPAYHTPLELGALYWHLVDLVWIFLWPLLYLTH